jgi:hypothetical protein
MSSLRGTTAGPVAPPDLFILRIRPIASPDLFILRIRICFRWLGFASSEIGKSFAPREVDVQPLGFAILRLNAHPFSARDYGAAGFQLVAEWNIREFLRIVTYMALQSQECFA